MDTGDDPYKILEVSKDADSSEIKKSYRRLALKHHPDRHQEPKAKEAAQHKFAKISAAFEVLSDYRKRKDYDDSQVSGSGSKKSGGSAAKGFDQRRMNVVFNDPYEVWKRDFEQQFGFPYPGAQWDFKEQPNKQLGDGRKVRGGQNSDSDSSDSDSSDSDSDSESDDSSSDSDSNDYDEDNNGNKDQNKQEDEPKRRSFLGALVPFRGRKDKEARTKSSSSDATSTAVVPHEDRKEKKKKEKKTSTDLVKKDKKKDKKSSSSTALTKRNKDPGSQALVVSNGVEGDNRPISMETTTEQVQHPDGTLETITKVRMVRPDGSIETVTTSDKAAKRPGWRQPETQKQPDRLRLTNGETKNQQTKQLTNGNTKKTASDKKKNVKAITNGEKGSSDAPSSSSSALVKSKKKKKSSKEK